MIRTINQDICLSEVKYIVHQVNLITTKASGLARQIFKRYPYSDIYSNRIKNYYPDKSKLGTINICGNGKDSRYIINLFGQYFPGKPQYIDSKLDGYKSRENYFKQSLQEIAKIDGLESIGFPVNIGCGLAGGNWNDYFKMIKEFDEYVSKSQNAKTFLFNYQP